MEAAVAELTYWVWVLMACAVATVAASKGFFLWRAGECSDRLWLIIGIAMSWGMSALNKAWFTIWREFGTPLWMIDNWVTLAFSVLIVVAAAVHLWAFTRARIGNWGWLSIFGLIVAIAFLIRGIT